jgi:hypothetical protein
VRQGKAGQARETDEGDVVEEEGVKRRVRSKAEPSKLEKSRMSARECRVRKKLRYEYLEELVKDREKAIGEHLWVYLEEIMT